MTPRNTWQCLRERQTCVRLALIGPVINAASGSHSEMADSTSADLIPRAQSRDHEAWQRLSKLYGPIVPDWACRAGLQLSDAVDVMQEVFRAVALNVGDFRHDDPSHSFRGWLWTVTRNKIRDHYRDVCCEAVRAYPIPGVKTPGHHRPSLRDKTGGYDRPSLYDESTLVAERPGDGSRGFQPTVGLGNLETICLKCLAKAPEARYRSCQHLTEELRSFLSNQSRQIGRFREVASEA